MNEFLIDVENAVCFTGYRPQKMPANGNESSQRIIAIKAKLLECVEDKIKEGFNYFLVGMAEGFDSYAALAVMELKQRYPKINLIAVIPAQDTKHSKTNRKILKASQAQITIAKKTGTVAYLKRNRFLVDNSSCVICYYTGKMGGTHYAVSYAQARSKEIVNVAESLKS